MKNKSFGTVAVKSVFRLFRLFRLIPLTGVKKGRKKGDNSYIGITAGKAGTVVFCSVFFSVNLLFMAREKGKNGVRRFWRENLPDRSAIWIEHAMGGTAGAPDLAVLLPDGRVVWTELKGDIKSPIRESQKKVLSNIIANNGLAGLSFFEVLPNGGGQIVVFRPLVLGVKFGPRLVLRPETPILEALSKLFDTYDKS